MKRIHKKRAALLLAEYDDFLLSVVHALGEAGYGVHAQVSDARRGGFFRSSRYCRSSRTVPTLIGCDHAALEAHIRRIQEDIDRRSIDVVVGVDVFGILLLSRIRTRLRGASLFPTAETEALRTLNNKHSFANFCLRHGIPHPETHLVRRTTDLDALGPWTHAAVKLLDDDWGNVKILAFPDETHAYVERLLTAGNGPLLIQKFIPGTDVDLSLLAHGGKIVCHTVQEWLPEGGLLFYPDPKILDLCSRIVELSRFEGLMHLDLRREPNGSVRVLECNPRFWGSLNASVRCGVNFAELGARLALGLPVPDPIGVPSVRYGQASSLLKGIARGRIAAEDFPGPVIKNFLHHLADPVPVLHKALVKRIRKKTSRDNDIRPCR